MAVRMSQREFDALAVPMPKKVPKCKSKRVKAAKEAKPPSALEVSLSKLIADSELPLPCREFKFHETRRWRFDFAWPEFLVAVEVEGGVWTGGRHTRGVGFEGDCEKYAEALTAGWKVLRVTGKHIRSGRAMEWLRMLLVTQDD